MVWVARQGFAQVRSPTSEAPPVNGTLLRSLALLLMVIGVVGVHEALVSPEQRLLPAAASTGLMFVGPILISLGAVAIALDIARIRSASALRRTGATLLLLGSFALLGITFLGILENGSPQRYGILFTVALLGLAGPALILLLTGSVVLLRARRTTSRRR